MSEDTTQQHRQHISVSIDGQRLHLRVPRQEEARYRLAAEELVRTTQRYQAKYPNVSEVGHRSYLAMAALDVALRYRELSDYVAQQRQTLEPRLSELNDSLEALLSSASATLEP